MNLHILRAPATTTADEKAQLSKLTKLQRKYLSSRCCGLCDKPLDETGCGGIYEACPEQVRIDRRERCLAEYKPRKAS